MVLGGVAVAVVAGIGIGAIAGNLAGAGAATPSGSPPIAQVSTPPSPGGSTPLASVGPSAAASATPSGSPSPTPPAGPTLVAAPLTGRPVTAEVASRHPVAVMVDDLLAARPQSGFSAASVVWHAPAEGGIPRYMMVFQDQVPKDIGPVRSARYYFIAWASEWRAVYAHSGGSPQAKETLAAKGRGQLVYNADEFAWSGSFHRVTFRTPPHNLYTDGATLNRLGARLGAKPSAYKAAWSFAPDAPLEARPTGGTIRVSFPYNKVIYRYDRTSNTYLRSVSGESKQVDRTTKTRVAPQNVIVMLMQFSLLPDAKHRLEAKVTGSGRAWISTNGRTIKGTWKKSSLTGKTQFFDSKGRAVKLTVGQTFIEVVPAASDLSLTPGKAPTTAPAPSPSQSAAGGY
ncbi:MAG: DUF3048 domain-containing protein [Chloroflexota bacterium]